jgi:amino acid transporter
VPISVSWIGLTSTFQITKIFPRPALITATCFAWFFVAFSTSTGNGLNFAKYISLAGANFKVEDDAPKVIDTWQLKFIACWIVVAICLLHYRLIDIGVWSNFGLAGYKVLLVTILVIATWAGLSHQYQQGTVRGAHDWRDFNIKKSPIEDQTGGKAVNAPVNTALAMFLVMYSYQGWENASMSYLGFTRPFLAIHNFH